MNLWQIEITTDQIDVTFLVAAENTKSAKSNACKRVPGECSWIKASKIEEVDGYKISLSK